MLPDGTVNVGVGVTGVVVLGVRRNLLSAGVRAGSQVITINM